MAGTVTVTYNVAVLNENRKGIYVDTNSGYLTVWYAGSSWTAWTAFEKDPEKRRDLTTGKIYYKWIATTKNSNSSYAISKGTALYTEIHWDNIKSHTKSPADIACYDFMPRTVEFPAPDIRGYNQQAGQYDDKNLFYDIFSNCVPYYCGDQYMLSDEFFENAVHHQKYFKDVNPFCIEVPIAGYVSPEGKTSGCLVGSTPLAGIVNNDSSKSHKLVGQGASYISKIDIYMNNEGTLMVDNGDTGSNISRITTQQLIDNYGYTGAADQPISRLGVVLIGSGGNAGQGYMWKENCCGCSVQLYAPGAGGGGGGVLWGVIDLTQVYNNGNKYTINVAEHPNGLGADGNATTLYYKKKLGTNSYESLPLAAALGGIGGGVGGKNGEHSGGVGGHYELYHRELGLFWPIAYIDGTQGTSYNYDTSTVAKAAPTSFNITFLRGDNTTPANLATHVAASSPMFDNSWDELKQEDSKYRDRYFLSGGNSYGNGAYRNSSSPVAAVNGGGGGSYYKYTNNGGKDVGGNGGWELYY